MEPDRDDRKNGNGAGYPSEVDVRMNLLYAHDGGWRRCHPIRRHRVDVNAFNQRMPTTAQQRYTRCNTWCYTIRVVLGTHMVLVQLGSIYRVIHYLRKRFLN